MNYTIEQKGAFRIVGPRIATTMENEKAFDDIPKFWAEAGMNGTLGRLCGLMGGGPQGLFGACVGDAGGSPDFYYYIAVSSREETPDGMHEFMVPACTWAVFECVGPMPGAIQNMHKRIHSEWLPGSGYEYDCAPDIEVYGEGDITAGDYKSWIWLPVRPKAGGV